MDKQMILPIGPQHPLLKEPVHFKFTIEGEKVVDADIRLGYNHRGIEKAAEDMTYIQSLYMIERICGICSMVHATNFCMATEEIAKVEVPPRAKYIRIIMAELERLHSHLLWLSVAGHEVGFDTLFMVAMRDREVVQDMLEMIGGNRVNYGINSLGGVRKDITPDQKEQVLKALKIIEERTSYYAKVATSETTFMARVSGVGILPKEIAHSHGAVGPTARGSGLSYDVRKDLPYSGYDTIPFDVITSDLCDVLGRTIVRVGEIIESIKIIRYALEHLPDGPIQAKVPRRIPVGEAFSRYEAPRGEATQYVRANGTDKPDRVKVRASTNANLISIRHTLLNQQVADIPIIIAAIDPCLSCTDRTAVMMEDAQSGKQNILLWKDLRKLSIEKHPL